MSIHEQDSYRLHKNFIPNFLIRNTCHLISPAHMWIYAGKEDMSAYSDYKYGCISYEEYESIENTEARRDEDLSRMYYEEEEDDDE